MPLPAPPAVPSAQPTGGLPAPDPTGVPLTSAQTAAWRRRVTAALEATKPAIEEGKVNVDRYKAKYLAGKPAGDTILVPTDYYYIEQRKARLFYRLPDVVLKPEQPGKEDAAIVFQAALNQKLGPAGVHILPTVQEVIFDVLCPTGFGAIALGHETITDGEIEVQVGEEPDLENLQPGSVLGLGPTPMKPIMESVPNVLATRYFAERVSPGDLLMPAEFIGSDADKGPWIGQRFREDLPDDDGSGADSEADDRRLVPLSAAAQTARRKQRVGHEIFYKAAQFDADAKHPDLIRTFKLYDDDKNSEVVPTTCPYQRFDGRKVTGMLGFPITPLTIRYVSDSWNPPSDCTMARAQADELSKGRTQQIQFRNRSMPQFGYDATRVTKDTLAKIERNENAAGIGFDGPFEGAVGPIEKGRFGRESFTFDEIIKSDLNRIWGIPEHQLSGNAGSGKTATELQLVDSASKTREEADRSKVMDWYVTKIVAKFGALMQLFASEEEFVELIGSDAQRLKAIPPEIAQQAQQAGQNASVLVPWNKDAIQGPFAFSAKPDSQLHLDLVQQREQLMRLYQFTANEPTINRQELVKELLKAFHFDPAKFSVPPPQKQAEAPKPSLSFTGADFSPMVAQSPICLDMVTKLGVPVDPEAIKAALQLSGLLQAQAQAAAEQEAINGAGDETAHGGAVKQQEPLSKHAQDLTGGMQGTGNPAPLGAGGGNLQ